MKIHFLGTCAGTEPQIGRHHTAVMIETNDALYQFDAGECCAYTAYATMGIDLLKMRALFVTHPHVDHQGGLPHWIFTLPKLCVIKKTVVKFDSIDVILPDTKSWDAACAIAFGTERVHAYADKVKFNVKACLDGIVFEDENLKVEAIHNLHLGIPANGVWTSFSYRVICEGKSIVISGDIKSLDDIAPFIKNKTDILLIETGHHIPENLAASLVNYPVETLIYYHNGRAILNDYNGSKERIAAVWKKPFTISEDAMTMVF